VSIRAIECQVLFPNDWKGGGFIIGTHSSDGITVTGMDIAPSGTLYTEVRTPGSDGKIVQTRVRECFENTPLADF
jgi:hypothetical protein